jgi:hypothetical protein
MGANASAIWACGPDVTPKRIFSANAGEAASMDNRTADRAPRMNGVYFMQIFLEVILGGASGGGAPVLFF